jgi:hypothetical protein
MGKRTLLSLLDHVDWEDLEHAYGSAEDTPDRLRALLDADPERRREARYWLSGSLAHQGTLYSASAPAVPFLVAAACERDVPDRTQVLALLAELAVGAPGRFTWSGFDLGAPHMRGWFDGEDAAPFLASYEAVEAGLPRLLGLLRDPDPLVRTHAAFTTALFSRHAAAVRDAVRAAEIEERDPRAIASQLLALGVLDNYLQDASSQARMRAHLDGPVALAAAVALSYGAQPGRGAAPEALPVLRRSLCAAPPEPVEGLPWGDGDVARLAIEHATKHEATGEVIDLLFAVVERPVDDADARAVSLARAALRPLFRLVTPEAPPEGGFTQSTVRPPLRRFAEAVARRPFLVDAALLDALAVSGLPGDLEPLQRFLEIGIPSVLDARVAVFGADKSVAEHLAGGLGAEARADLVRAVAAREDALAIAVAIEHAAARGPVAGAVQGASFRVTESAPPRAASRDDLALAIAEAAAAHDPEATASAARRLAETFATKGPPVTHGRTPRIVTNALTVVARAAAASAEKSGRAPDEVVDVVVEGELDASHAWPDIERYCRAIGGDRTAKLFLRLAERGWKKTWPDPFAISVDGPLFDRILAVVDPAARERLVLAVARTGDTSPILANVRKYATPRVVELLVERGAEALEGMKNWAKDEVEEAREQKAREIAAAGLLAYGPVSRLLAERRSSSSDDDDELVKLCQTILDAVDDASFVGSAMRDARVSPRDERGLMPLASARRIVEATTIYRKGDGEMRDGTFVLESDVVWAALLSLETAEELVRHAKRIDWQFHVRGRDNLALFERWGAAILPWIESRIDDRSVLTNVPWCLVPCLLAIDSKDALRVALKVEAVHERLPGQAPLGDGPGVYAESDDEDDVDDDVEEEDDEEDEPAPSPKAFVRPTTGLDLARRWISHHAHGYAMLAELADDGDVRAAELLRERANALGGVVHEAIEAALGKGRTETLAARLGLPRTSLAPEIEALLAAAETIDEPRGPLWTVAELDDAAREYTLPLWDNARYTTGAMRITGFASRHGDALVVETLYTNPSADELVGWQCDAYGPGAKERQCFELLVDARKDELERVEIASSSDYVDGVTNEIHLWGARSDKGKPIKGSSGWRIVPSPLPHEHAILRPKRAANPHRFEARVTHRLPRSFAALAAGEAAALCAVSPEEGLLFQLCAKYKDDLFAFDAALREKLGLPSDAVRLFSFDDFEWVAAGELASRSVDVVAMVEALRRRKKIGALLGTPNARPEAWAPGAAEVRSYAGPDAWAPGEDPIEPLLPEGGPGATPYLSWLVTRRGYPHGVSLLHAPEHNLAGQAEQTIPYLMGCTEPVMQVFWPRRTACLWARVAGGAETAWSADDRGVARALKDDSHLYVVEAAAIVQRFVARPWSPPAHVGAELASIVEALVGPRETLVAFADALAALPPAAWTSDCPALAAAAFELGFVLRRTPGDVRDLVAKLEGVAKKAMEAGANDVSRAIDLVLHGREAAERSARTELDYAFVEEEHRAWARERILDPKTSPSRPDLFLLSIAGDGLIAKWESRLEATEPRWLAIQVAKAAGPAALALALRLYRERPETVDAIAQTLLERPGIEEELTAALRGPHAEAARALLGALEAKRDEEYEDEDDDDDEDDEDDLDEDGLDDDDEDDEDDLDD